MTDKTEKRRSEKPEIKKTQKKTEQTAENQVAKEKGEKRGKASNTRNVLAIFWSGTKKIFKILFILTVIIILGTSIYVINLYGTYAKDFKNSVAKSGSTQATFYDKNGDIIYQGFGMKEPENIPLQDIPDLVKKATLAAEDLHFYSHGPIDIRGLARATYKNYQNSQGQGLSKISALFNENAYTQGGSTISQQLIKNQYLTNERSFERKIKEVVFAIELEKIRSKDKILEDYLNNIYYGEQSLGIKNAARTYFDKELTELDLAETSMLAGLPQAPSEYSPVSGDYEKSKKRQEYVLQQMLLAGFIDEKTAREAANKPLDFKGGYSIIDKYPYFSQYVKEELTARYGKQYVETGGLQVYTSLDPDKQIIAEEKTAEYVKKFATRDVSNAAAVIMDNKNNNVLAMVGGVDWEESKVNVATSLRQPGSSFKPIVYAAGFLEGYSPATKLLDISLNFGGNPPYRPKNYDGGYRGNVSVRTALANSLNIPAVEMTKLVGVEDIIKEAGSLGITTIDKDANSYGLSIGLGSAETKLIEMVEVYSTFADGGKRTTPSGIIKVMDNKSNQIYNSDRQKKTVIDPRAAYMINSILSDNKARQAVFGSGNKLEIKNHTVAAKTGTTDEYSDSWTIGYTPDITVGVWMGNNDRKEMKVISGIEGAAYIWHDIMVKAIEGSPDKKFEKPKDISERWINPYTFSETKREGSPNILEYFIPGKEPGERPDFSYLDVFTKKKR